MVYEKGDWKGIAKMSPFHFGNWIYTARQSPDRERVIQVFFHFCPDPGNRVCVRVRGAPFDDADGSLYTQDISSYKHVLRMGNLIGDRFEEDATGKPWVFLSVGTSSVPESIPPMMTICYDMSDLMDAKKTSAKPAFSGESGPSSGNRGPSDHTGLHDTQEEAQERGATGIAGGIAGPPGPLGPAGVQGPPGTPGDNAAVGLIACLLERVTKLQDDRVTKLEQDVAARQCLLERVTKLQDDRVTKLEQDVAALQDNF